MPRVMSYCCMSMGGPVSAAGRTKRDSLSRESERHEPVGVGEPECSLIAARQSRGCFGSFERAGHEDSVTRKA